MAKGEDGLPPVDWAGITEKLEVGSGPAPDAHNARTTWLVTLNSDVARDPRCSIAVSIRDAETDPGTVSRVARAWADQGWPAEPDASGSGITAPFNAPAQGPPPWEVYRVEPRAATVVLGVEPGGLTRFTF